MDNLVVKVKEGLIEGKIEKSVRVFKGVPYAQPPVGNLRFKLPQPKQGWNGVRCCKDYSSKAFQPDMSKDPFYGKEFYYGDDVAMSEDCLYLNIFAPQKAENCPVMVWIHGGGFDHGYGSEIEFLGHNFAKQGIICITINYRVGALGFFSHPQLDEEQGSISGNQGVYDQLFAIKWVKENVSAFGGNPDNITVAGQSAGCISTQILISSPLSAGLINKAILQSAGGIPGFSVGDDMSELKAHSQKLMEKLDVSTIDELRTLSAENIAYTALEIARQTGGMIWRPAQDGTLLSGSLADIAYNGDIPDIPYIIGSTADEMGGGTAQMMSGSVQGFAGRMARLGRTPVYAYKFNHKLPGDDAGAFHSCELWYEFGTMDACWRPFTKKDFEISRQMSTFFANFMRTGNPNGDNLPHWSAYSEEKDTYSFE